MKTVEVMQQALDHFGEINQTDKAIEELGELIVALSRYRQAEGAEKTQRAIEVITELADAKIMIKQMILLFGAWEVEQQIKFKIDRLIDRMGHG